MSETLNFADLPDEFTGIETARIAILPAPFDFTSTWRKGADHGPEAILAASAHMELYDIETDSEVYKRGIHTSKTLAAADVSEMVHLISDNVTELLLKNKFPVVLGGEHSVSIGSINACAKRYPDLSVLQLDAHGDTRNSYEGSPYNHACVMARAKEKVNNTMAVGIRSIDASERDSLNPGKTVFAHEISENDDSWMDKVVVGLSGPVYVTIDLDVFDPGIMPATGTPEPGGLSYRQVIGLLKKLTQKHEIIGFDVVELCPEENPAPDFLAAKLIYQFLSLVFETTRE